MSDARQFWDREILQQQHVSWMEDPVIHEYINQSIGGAEAMWPIDWFERWLGGRKFGRALSIGCGGGALERDLVKRGLVARIDAFDGSVGSLHIARTTADREGLGDRIRYFAADFNEPLFARRRGIYDVVFFHQSAHHVAKLEKLYRAILIALKRDGLLYLDEYVGPSRFDWNDELVAVHRAAYAALPPQTRTLDALPYPIQEDDPSEAFRSSEIEPQLAVGFDVVARRPYGGTLLSVLYPALRREFVTPDLIERLIDDERRLLAAGAPSYYTIVVAKPKRALRKLAASADYFVRPKAQRVLREVRARLARSS